MFGRMGSEEEFRAPGGTDINIFSYFTVQFSFLPKFYKSCFLHLFVLITEKVPRLTAKVQTATFNGHQVHIIRPDRDIPGH